LGGAHVNLNAFREKLRMVCETCDALLFVLENPELFHSLKEAEQHQSI
jgi:hypothetical protein